MGAIDQILSILLNSKTVPQLPPVNDYLDEDILPYYKNSVGQMVGLSMANLLRNISVSDSYLGTVTTAGSTSTETEIIDFINSEGFTIAPNELKIISLNTLVDGSVFYNSFIYKLNAPGNYGNGGTVVSYSDLFKFNVQLLNSFDDVVVKIDLGNIGSDPIETAINNGNEIELLANVVYVFECIISGTNKKYLYTGAQPIFIGGGNNSVTASNFIDITDDSGGDYLPTGGYTGTAQDIVDLIPTDFSVAWNEITGDQKDVNLSEFTNDLPSQTLEVYSESGTLAGGDAEATIGDLSIINQSGSGLYYDQENSLLLFNANTVQIYSTDQLTFLSNGTIEINKPNNDHLQLNFQSVTDSKIQSFQNKDGTIALENEEYTVATLPSTPSRGDKAFITDATSPTYLGVAVGGGSVFCEVMYNGTDWVTI